MVEKFRMFNELRSDLLFKGEIHPPVFLTSVREVFASLSIGRYRLFLSF
jgi:hypothetical protein